jgi:hypothetical protein
MRDLEVAGSPCVLQEGDLVDLVADLLDEKLLGLHHCKKKVNALAVVCGERCLLSTAPVPSRSAVLNLDGWHDVWIGQEAG